MKLLLILCWVLGASADVLHDDLVMNGCSDSYGEEVYTLDGEEKWYADFKNQRGVEPQPDFIDHISYSDPEIYELAVAELQICRFNLNVSRISMKDLPLEKDPPSGLTIYSKDEVELGVQNVLICHVSGFYPAPVNVSWTKNGEKLTEGTSINRPFPNKDGSFNQISRLKFIPQQGDIYSCSVEHLALDQPLTRIWGVCGPAAGEGDPGNQQDWEQLGLPQSPLHLPHYLFRRRSAVQRWIVNAHTGNPTEATWNTRNIRTL